jgi:hypothetical protein
LIYKGLTPEVHWTHSSGALLDWGVCAAVTSCPSQPDKTGTKNSVGGIVFAVGLGLSDDAFRLLIDDWIVPRLVQTFVEQEANLEIAFCSEKKPVRSVLEVSSLRGVAHSGIKLPE